MVEYLSGWVMKADDMNDFLVMWSSYAKNAIRLKASVELLCRLPCPVS